MRRPRARAGSPGGGGRGGSGACRGHGRASAAGWLRHRPWGTCHSPGHCPKPRGAIRHEVARGRLDRSRPVGRAASAPAWRAARCARTRPREAHAGAGHQRRRPDGSRKTHRQSLSSQEVRNARSGPRNASNALTAMAASTCANVGGDRAGPRPPSAAAATVTASTAAGSASRASAAARASSRRCSRSSSSCERWSVATGRSGRRPMRSSQASTAASSGSRSTGLAPKDRPCVASRFSQVAPPSVRKSQVVTPQV